MLLASSSRESDQSNWSFSEETEVVSRLRIRRPHRSRRAGKIKLSTLSLWGESAALHFHVINERFDL